jgi:hypothetical protein
MAKCMRHRKLRHVERVADEDAATMFATGDWDYVSKSDYKRWRDSHGKQQSVEQGPEAQPQIS